MSTLLWISKGSSSETCRSMYRWFVNQFSGCSMVNAVVSRWKLAWLGKIRTIQVRLRTSCWYGRAKCQVRNSLGNENLRRASIDSGRSLPEDEISNVQFFWGWGIFSCPGIGWLVGYGWKPRYWCLRRESIQKRRWWRIVLGGGWGLQEKNRKVAAAIV